MYKTELMKNGTAGFFVKTVQNGTGSRKGGTTPPLIITNLKSKIICLLSKGAQNTKDDKPVNCHTPR